MSLLLSRTGINLGRGDGSIAGTATVSAAGTAIIGAVGSIASAITFQRPNSDLSNVFFTNQLGSSTNLWQSIDETGVADDSDYIQSDGAAVGGGTDFYNGGLSTGVDPGIDTGHELHYRYSLDVFDGTQLNVDFILLHAGVNIAVDSFTLNTATGWIDGVLPLTTGQAATITNYASLSWSVSISDNFGNATVCVFKVSDVYLQLPGTGGATAQAVGQAFSVATGSSAGTSTASAVSDYPRILSVTPTSVGTASTTHNISMPAAVVADDLLLAFVGYDGNPTINTPAGWTNIGVSSGNATVNFAAFAKKAVGTEGGTTVDFSTNVSVEVAAQVYRIDAKTWSPNSNIFSSIFNASTATGTSVNPDAPSISDAVGGFGKGAHVLHITFYAAADSSPATVYPTGFSGGTYTESSTNGTAVSLGTAYKSLELPSNSASENAPAFTITSSKTWVATSIWIDFGWYKPARTSTGATVSGQAGFTASATGTGTATSTSAPIIAATASVAGTSTVSGIPEVGSIGSSTGTSTASGVGISTVVATASSTGTSPVAAISDYPRILSVTTTSFPTDTTSHVVSMPATVAANDLLIALVSSDGNSTVSTPSGWTSMSTGGGASITFTIFKKQAAGTEGGTTVDFVTSAVQEAAIQVYQIAADSWSQDLGIGISITTNGGTSTTPNPTTNTPIWKKGNTLWIAAIGIDESDDVTVYPTNYVNGVYTESANNAGSSVSVASAYRAFETESENPGAFTLAGVTRDWSAATISVQHAWGRAPTAAGISTVTATGGATAAATASSAGTSTASFASDYPRILSVTPTSVGTASTSHNISMPATTVSGDLLVAILSFRSNPGVTTPTGWTARIFGSNTGQALKLAVFTKTAGGTEGGTTVDWVTDISVEACAQVYRIAKGTVVDFNDGGTLVSFTGATPDTPSNSSFTSRDHILWISTYASTNGYTISSYPSGYSGGIYTESSASATASSLGSAYNATETATGTEDPGFFLLSISRPWVGVTLGCRFPWYSRGATTGATTATGIGAATTAATASAAGTSTATGAGASTVAATASAAGTSTITGFSEAGSTGSSTGTSTASGVGALNVAATASSTGTSTISGQVGFQATTAGTSTVSGQAGFQATTAGTSTVSATGISTNAATASSTGTSTVSGQAGFRASAAGTSTVNGQAGFQAVVSGTGTATGVGASNVAATASSSGTGVANGQAGFKASASGTATVTATGIAVQDSGSGLSTGTGTATGVGISTAAATANSTGTSTVSGQVGFQATTSGTSTVNGQAGFTASTTGTGVASGVGRSTNAATVSSTGTSTVSGQAGFQATSAGTSTVSGQAGFQATTTGTGVVTGVGRSTNAVTANATGTGVASGVITVITPAVANATGSVFINGDSSGFFVSNATASGTSTVSGSGKGIFAAAGTSSGTSTITATGQRFAELAALISALVTTTSSITAQIKFLGSLQSVVSQNSDLLVPKPLNSQIFSLVSVIPVLSTQIRLSGSLFDTATSNSELTTIVFISGLAQSLAQFKRAYLSLPRPFNKANWSSSTTIKRDSPDTVVKSGENLITTIKISPEEPRVVSENRTITIKRQ